MRMHRGRGGQCVRGRGRGVSCEEREVWCVEDANRYMRTYICGSVEWSRDSIVQQTQL